MIRSNPRVKRTLVVTFCLFILLGWAYGDPWDWTVLRAVLMPLTMVGILLLYSKNSVILSAARVVLGVLSGAWCAWSLGADGLTVSLAALGFGTAFIGSEYLIRRELRGS